MMIGWVLHYLWRFVSFPYRKARRLYFAPHRWRQRRAWRLRPKSPPEACYLRFLYMGCGEPYPTGEITDMHEKPVEEPR